MTDFIPVFKFRSINKLLIDSLVKSQIYFSTPDQLNDPFDCQVDINKSLIRVLEAAPDREITGLEGILVVASQFFDQFQSDVMKMGVFSYSTEMLNTVMWSHYADQHRGLCLYYEIPMSYLDYESNGVIGVSPIEYGTDPLFHWFRSEAKAIADDNLDEMKIALMQKVLTIKSNDWAYENEGRMLAAEAGPRDIKPEYLKQVCFGLAAPQSDMDLVIKLINQHYPAVNFAKIESDKSDFNIVANDM